MRHLSRLFLIVCLLAGLAAAPAASLAAPAGHDQAGQATAGMHAHHMMAMQAEDDHPSAPVSHHGKDAAACAAWCAGAFLTALPRPIALIAAMPTSYIHPARTEPLVSLAVSPPLQPPRNMLS